MRVLTPDRLALAAHELARRDPDLGRTLARHGVPPMWDRAPGFASLILIVLEQQVSLASARAAYDRLTTATGIVTPEAFLRLDDTELKQIGFSRQKMGYGRALAEHIVSGSFNPHALDALDDAGARSALLALKGVGMWTADIYLLMALRRPDVWPRGDLALIKAAVAVKHAPARPTPEAWEALAEPWRPWRSVAARMLWQHYLAERRSHH